MIRSRSACVAVALAVFTVGCGGGGGGDDGDSIRESSSSQGEVFDASDAGLAPEMAPELAPGMAPDGGVRSVAVDRQLAVEMFVTMVTDDIRAAVDQTVQRARLLGGSVANSNVDFGDQSGGRAWLVLKVPPERAEDLVGSLDRWGTVRSVSQSTEDVTEQLVDLDVRIDNATRSVERIRALLAEARNVGEVMAVESELTIRQTELERLLATQQSIESRVAMTTVTVEMYTDPDEIDEARGGLIDALSDGWNGFVDVAVEVLRAAALALPYLVMSAVVGIVWMIWRRRTGPRSAGSTGDTPAPPPPD